MGAEAASIDAPVAETAIKSPVTPAVVASEDMLPLEEATKYLALGRHAQAEEILKEALKANPGQPTLLLKLLEVHSNSNDKRAFQSRAQELFAATGGTGDTWIQAARLGFAIDPGEFDVRERRRPLAAGTTTDLDFDLDVVAPKGLTETDLSVDADGLRTKSSALR